MTKEIPNPELKLAFNFVEQTNMNLFLTGKAGTGKTTFLRKLKEVSPKRMIVLAPTGVAAINAGGVTIHSFFQLHFGPHIPGHSQQFDQKSGSNQQKTFDRSQRFSKEKINIIKSLDLLVIDEISMVRADLLDSIDEVLRKYKDRSKPFGGIQLLMIGDLQQLAPVVKDEEWEILRHYYDTAFFFGSRALQKTNFTTIELRHIYRQSDEHFIALLNKVRDNIMDQQAIDTLNLRYIQGFDPGNDEGYITLTTHNYQSQAINEAKLKQIAAVPFSFTAVVQGEFPEYSYPTDFELVLKVGAQVMFVKNDISREKLFYNGKIGKIVEIEDDTVFVKCEGEEFVIPVQQAEWQNNKYSINNETKEITETPVGSFVQYPLKLAWAITIHKSQGLTFERAIIDANAAFAHGQVYVALSRCKTMEGMVLSSKISHDCIKSDLGVKGFSEQAELNRPGERELQASRIAYQQTLLVELLDFIVLQRKLHTIQKLIRENSNVILPSLSETFAVMSDKLASECIGITARFNSQIGQLLIGQPMIEENQALLERLKKACDYFAGKTEEIVCEVLQNTEIETDNKELKKSLKEAFENLYREAYIKTACFKACSEGFFVKTYLDARAKASIEKIHLKKVQKSFAPISSSEFEHSSLLQEIKYWRHAQAELEEIPLYMVLPQKTLYELVDKLPRNLKQLREIKGFGKTKVLKYGDELLAMICTHLDVELPDISVVELVKNVPSAKLKPKKGQTRLISLEMFNQGNSIEQIAARRSLTVSTVGGHLARFVLSGELEIEKLISSEKLKNISDYFDTAENISISQAISEWGNQFSYWELKMVRAYMSTSQHHAADEQAI